MALLQASTCAARLWAQPLEYNIYINTKYNSTNQLLATGLAKNRKADIDAFTCVVMGVSGRACFDSGLPKMSSVPLRPAVIRRIRTSPGSLVLLVNSSALRPLMSRFTQHFYASASCRSLLLA